MQGKLKYLQGTHRSATLTTANHTQSEVGMNLSSILGCMYEANSLTMEYNIHKDNKLIANGC
jgi:hypothetical protein